MATVHHGFGLRNILLILAVALLLFASYSFQKEARMAYNERKGEGQVLGESINLNLPLECLVMEPTTDYPPRFSDPNSNC